ncbi:GNAT family N-acetyltransferase [Streptomyces alkaliphilus]|uniref:GNAT family N-acetyltransferase n=1 Tax=Streptomyces alkaliphilus TaxID=1472722 RepID=A0A7W3Y352_9ACTN|nr:GNAT family N-acetyltransferase [Streptomyces alkaliphilus]MBB0246238.1 GNAT family N-acetyltransferase [Streptomyces alkaliphilus]
MRIVTARFDHPDARKLNDIVQAEYAERYGSGGDVTPLAPEMFDPPRGIFHLVYDETDAPIATAGWRAMEDPGECYEPGDAEIKRMFVMRHARGRGLARHLLGMLEDSARAAGRTRMVLETGDQQPEAIGLYVSAGYVPAERKFGVYRCSENSQCYVKAL